MKQQAVVKTAVNVRKKIADGYRGLVLVEFQTDIAEVGLYHNFWPVLLIAAGCAGCAQHEKQHRQDSSYHHRTSPAKGIPGTP